MGWRESPNLPIKKTHPFRTACFSNPKKRKVGPVKEERETRLVAAERSAAIVSAAERAADISATQSAAIVPAARSAAATAKNITDKMLKANYVISAYISLLLNTTLVLAFFLMLVKFFCVIKGDIQVKLAHVLQANKIKVRECARQYYLNKCSPSERVPALEKQCAEWEVCMNQDPAKEEMTKVVFRVVGDSIEEFLAGISIRSAVIFTGAAILLLRFTRK